MDRIVTSSVRQVLLRQIARTILALDARPHVRVAIDGIDGAGKSTFAEVVIDNHHLAAPFIER